ncbi:MAG: D-alanyl-D-alanine carboxypeptidase/D-alanyl-D-alanine-endopeptidase [Planctomycetota bacterium]
MKKTLLFIAVLTVLAVRAPARSTAPEAKLDALLSSRAPAAGTFGVVVVAAKDGEVLYRRDALAPRIPASTMKLVTTGASFVALGDEAELVTRALAAAKPKPGGALEGDLVILGGGDPALDVARDGSETGKIDHLARAVSRAGVARIRGDLVLDDSRFDREFRAPGWPSDQLTRSYCAPVSALTVGRGCLTVVVHPGDAPGAAGRISLVPAARFLTVKNRVTTTAKKSEHRIHVSLPLDSKTVTVSGKVWTKSTGFPAEVTAPDPTLLFGEALRNRLAAYGVALGGGVVLRPGAAKALGEPVEIASVTSRLTDLVHVTNQESQNLYADCLFKNLGFLLKGEGTFASGGKATAAFAAKLGFPEGHVVQVDGSGLSRENRVTPWFLAKLLSHLYVREDWNEFVRSLPHGGQSGTSLRRRMKDLGRNVFAKTGTIRGVSGLAGYVRAKSGKVLTFAVLVNDRRWTASKSRGLQDAVCRIIFEGY